MIRLTRTENDKLYRCITVVSQVVVDVEKQSPRSDYLGGWGAILTYSNAFGTKRNEQFTAANHFSMQKENLKPHLVL